MLFISKLEDCANLRHSKYYSTERLSILLVPKFIATIGSKTVPIAAIELNETIVFVAVEPVIGIL